MSKVYEVLKRAEKKRKGQTGLTEAVKPRKASSKAPDFNMDQIMLGLHQSIESCLPDINHKVIQFVGSREGEGTSTVVREFARVVVAKEGKSVLILDADRINPSQIRYFDTHSKHTLAEVFKNCESVDTAICQAQDPNLWIGLVSASSEGESRLAESPYFDQTWDALRQRFDLILIDAPPVGSFTDNIALTRKSDGIILVVEAEKTRWPVINNVKERLIENGGNLIGVVLNKRQFHIPEWVYSRL